MLNPFNPKESVDDKLSVLDVKARDQSGWQFNIEMQMLPHAYFRQRIVYYLSRFHQQQIKEGDKYSKLQPTISVVFLNEVQHPEVPDYHLLFRLLEVTHHFPYSKDLELHLFELPKFTKTETELTSSLILDIWLYFLRHAEKMDSEAMPKALSNPVIAQAVKELLVLSQTDIERERYEARLKWQRDWDSGLEAARTEGKGEGLTEAKIGLIQFCERILARLQTPTEELLTLSPLELETLTEELQNQVLNRQGRNSS